MRLLASTDMALRVVMLLGRRGPGEQMNVETMAQQLGDLSRNHLHKIVQDLAALGVLRTIRGAGGGVTLAAPLEETRLGSLIRSLESDQAVVECFRADGGCCVLEPGCKLRVMLREAQESFYQEPRPANPRRLRRRSRSRHETQDCRAEPASALATCEAAIALTSPLIALLGSFVSRQLANAGVSSSVQRLPWPRPPGMRLLAC